MCTLGSIDNRRKYLTQLNAVERSGGRHRGPLIRGKAICISGVCGELGAEIS